MKRILPLLCCTLITLIALANPLDPKQPAALFDHLYEVNQEWKHFDASENLSFVHHFEHDNQRIKMHLKLVENHLRQNTPKGLNSQQIQKRNQTLDILKTYYEVARFPINHYHSARQPYFIDNHETACAVGHLIIETGFKSLAQQISKENNYAYVSELKSLYPELGQWAKAFGFTVNELAWIQPTYPPHQQSWNAVGNGEGTDGTINVMKAFGDEMLYLAGDFSTIDGVEANGIIAWDGNQWHTLGAGVNGTINDISIDAEGKVFIGGDFSLNEDASIVNLAYWSDGQWHGFNTSAMNGSIYTMHAMEDKLYIGGSFEIEYDNNTVIKNLAYISNGSYNLENQNGDFSVDNIVYDITNKGNQLLVAGEFLATAPQSVNSSVNKFQTKHLALWGNDPTISSGNWLQAYDLAINSSINAVFASEYRFYIGMNSDLQESMGIGIFESDTWNYDYCGKIDADNNQVIYGFLDYNGIMLTYGNIQYMGMIVFTNSSGISVLENLTNIPADGAQFDGPVFAAESFQEQIYFAGEFSSVQGESFPGLVSSPFNGIISSTYGPDAKDHLNIFSSSEQIQIRYEDFEENFNLEIYNLNGQLVSQKSLPSGSAETSITTHNWADGVYIFQAISKSGKIYSGKISVVD